jgi:tripartite-type tricarboxylate transporter receptor subunit TctC
MRFDSTYRFIAWLAATLSLAAFGQGYPARTITLVVPFAAGGPTDTIGRMMAERMSKSLGQTIVVENVAGAGGTIANTRVMKSPADGYLFAIGHVGTHVIAPAVQELKVDYVNDFDPVALIVSNPQVMVSRNGVPAADLKEFIAWVKANPGKMTYATGGPGTPSHVMGVHFAERMGAPFVIVHYKGSGPALQDVMAGHVDATFDQAATALGQARAGRVRAYAVTSKTRLTFAPDIPTVDEAGLPGFYMSIWHAFWMPKGTPRDVVAKLNAAVREALADPAVRKRLEDIGQEIAPVEQQTPEHLRAHLKAETEKWWPVINAAGIKAQ